MCGCGVPNVNCKIKYVIAIHAILIITLLSLLLLYEAFGVVISWSSCSDESDEQFCKEEIVIVRIVTLVLICISVGSLLISILIRYRVSSS